MNMKPYEVQLDSYSCGPVAIINALHYLNRDAGRALRRVIVTCCKTKAVHEDGFRGTKPDTMNITITNIIGKKVTHYTGISDCITALEHMRFNCYIVLYSYKENKKQYFHYIFTYKVHDSSSNTQKYYSQNDGSYREQITDLNSYIEGHLSLEGTHPIKYPQVWVIY